ncbi:MAG: hypothetical protein FWC26_05900 [Fibromonadales bacterium]|nr:hypothetical protein [Fibromonadales bacterium]
MFPEEFMGEGYVDGHCLDSERALMLYQDRWFMVLEYGNFNKGYYVVDSVVLPHFDFEVFENRQQIVLQNLNWHSDDPYLEYLKTPDRSVSFMSICPYKDKIFGIKYGRVIVMDTQKKSYENLVRYKLFKPVSNKHIPDWGGGEKRGQPMNLTLIRMKNDTIVLSRKQPKEGFMDTILLTPDGEHFVPKISDSLCLSIELKSGEQEYAADKEKCFGRW